MPSVMDIQQQQQQQQSATNAPGKSTPPPPTTTTDLTNVDPLTQAVLVLEKKQRNLGKRKEKLESYQEEAKKGKDLNKDQKEALQKYPDVLGQIECVKELAEQFKKIQIDSAKNQKRLSKQAAEEKRTLISQSLRQYAQIRYLLEHRPIILKSDESTLLDQLSTTVLPTDNSSDTINRSIDTVLSIYQNGPASIIKNLTGKTPQEVRDTIEELIKNANTQQEISSTTVPSVPLVEQPPVKEQEQIKEIEQTNDIQPPPPPPPTTTMRIVNEYPLQFDTRNQNIPLEQIIHDPTFFSIDSNNQIEDNNRDQLNEQNQYIPTMTVINSNINDQPTPATESQQQHDEQQGDGQWQQRRGNMNPNRGGQFNGNRNYNRRGANNYHQQQRGGTRGRYEHPYGGNQRPYNEHSRGRGGYRGNRGGNYRGHNNANGYQNAAQHQQAHSAPPPSQQQ